MHGCCAKLFRGFTRCVRGVGLGNPGATIQNINFQSEDPLAKSADVSRATSGRRLSVSQDDVGAYLEDVEEEEEIADELQSQVCLCLPVCSFNDVGKS